MRLLAMPFQSGCLLRLDHLMTKARQLILERFPADANHFEVRLLDVVLRLASEGTRVVVVTQPSEPSARQVEPDTGPRHLAAVPRRLGGAAG